MPVLANKTSNLYKSFLLVLMFGFSYVSAALGDNQASISYNSPADASEQELAQVLKSSGVVEDVVAFINQKIRLSEPLYFMIGGDEGPLYDPSLNKIFIPYRFVQEVEERFSAAKYSETGVSVADATLDSVMHTLFHELAHALISNYQLPVVGKEEDAADSLASMLLIEYFDNGAEIAISAADLFDLESEEIDALEDGDFWDEHSLDAQRFYSTMCFVYGSNPEQYDSLIKELGLSQERAELCIEEYESIVRSWFTILKPYLK
jgi:hypothetical protein